MDEGTVAYDGSFRSNFWTYFIYSRGKAWSNKFDLQDKYPATVIDENDVYQLYAGLMCKHYILSESTFHLWIAYLGTIKNDDKQVIVFNDTAILRKNLSLDKWIKIDY